MRGVWTSYKHAPRLVQLGIISLAVGAMLDVQQHMLPLDWGLFGSHAAAEPAVIGHLVTFLGMVIVMVGILHRKIRVTNRLARHRRRQRSQPPENDG